MRGVTDDPCPRLSPSPTNPLIRHLAPCKPQRHAHTLTSPPHPRPKIPVRDVSPSILRCSARHLHHPVWDQNTVTWQSAFITAIPIPHPLAHHASPPLAPASRWPVSPPAPPLLHPPGLPQNPGDAADVIHRIQEQYQIQSWAVSARVVLGQLGLGEVGSSGGGRASK